jgi:hypothetical protein
VLASSSSLTPAGVFGLSLTLKWRFLREAAWDTSFCGRNAAQVIFCCISQRHPEGLARLTGARQKQEIIAFRTQFFWDRTGIGRHQPVTAHHRRVCQLGDSFVESLLLEQQL